MGEWIRIAEDGGKVFDGYLATPPKAPGPGLLLIQEIFGVNQHIREMAELYALAGFTVLAPDLFWRQQTRVELSYEGDDLQAAMGYLRGVDIALTGQDLALAVRSLRALPECAGKVGTVGYCLGGRMAYVAAAVAGVDAACAYYGGGIHTQLDLAPQIQVPMLFHFGAEDSLIPPEAVTAVAAALPASQREVHLYPGAGHGFNCARRAAYHRPSAVLAQGRTLEFLARTLF